MSEMSDTSPDRQNLLLKNHLITLPRFPLYHRASNPHVFDSISAPSSCPQPEMAESSAQLSPADRRTVGLWFVEGASSSADQRPTVLQTADDGVINRWRLGHHRLGSTILPDPLNCWPRFSFRKKNCPFLAAMSDDFDFNKVTKRTRSEM